MICYSFLIPFWNLETWMLQRMLDSIPHREDVEIILLDNASDAIDRERLPGREDSRVRIFFQEERKTVGYCRNALIGLARGEWIIFADADDRFFTEELERLMVMPGKGSYDLIYWGLQQFFPDGTAIDDSLGYHGTEIQPLTDKVYPLSHKYESPHKMARRSLLLAHPEIRFDEVPIYEDVAYGVRLLLGADRVGIYPPMVYQYLRRDTSTLGRSDWSVPVLEDTLRHLFGILDVLKRHHYPVHVQEVTKGCLIRLKHVSRGRFFCVLWQELSRFGWPLFYRDLVGAGFETYETRLSRAFIDYLRVKAGALLRALKRSTSH